MKRISLWRVLIMAVLAAMFLVVIGGVLADVLPKKGYGSHTVRLEHCRDWLSAELAEYFHRQFDQKYPLGEYKQKPLVYIDDQQNLKTCVKSSAEMQKYDGIIPQPVIRQKAEELYNQVKYGADFALEDLIPDNVSFEMADYSQEVLTTIHDELLDNMLDLKIFALPQGIRYVEVHTEYAEQVDVIKDYLYNTVLDFEQGAVRILVRENNIQFD